ncbi:MAG: hypothetical protein AAFW98_15220, partial [Pseudomonadota bacterium]
HAYNLTTVRQRRRTMVSRAIGLLDALIAGAGEHVNERVAGTLIVRGSTRPGMNAGEDDSSLDSKRPKNNHE